MKFLLLTTENVDIIPKYIGSSVVFKNNLKNPQMETVIGFSITDNTVSLKITNTRHPKTNKLNICKINSKTGEWENHKPVYLIANHR
jgi:hypothetical protein